MSIQTTINSILRKYGTAGTITWPDSGDLMNVNTTTSNVSTVTQVLITTRAIALTDTKGWTSQDIATMPVQNRDLVGATLTVGNTSWKIVAQRTSEGGNLGQLMTQVTLA